MSDQTNGPDYACEHGVPLDADCADCNEIDDDDVLEE